MVLSEIMACVLISMFHFPIIITYEFNYMKKAPH